MQIKGENRCLVCNENIQWIGIIRDGQNMDVFSGSRVQASLVAIDKMASTSGKRVTFEATVQCPCCRNNNKFEITSSVPIFV